MVQLTYLVDKQLCKSEGMMKARANECLNRLRIKCLYLLFQNNEVFKLVFNSLLDAVCLNVCVFVWSGWVNVCVWFAKHIFFLFVYLLEPAVASCAQRPVDLVFLLDGSERLGLDNFRRAQEFVERVSQRLTLARDKDDERNARISLVQYGGESDQRVVFPLSHNFTLITDALSRMSYMDSSSSVGPAITYAINNVVMSNRDRQARRHAELAFVFLTDGVTSEKGLSEGIVAMRRSEAVPVVVAMGNDVDQEVLTKLALQDEAAIFRGQDFNQLAKSNFFERFIRWIC